MTPKLLNLSESELARLEEIVGDYNYSPRVRRRADSLIKIHLGHSYYDISITPGLSPATISNIKRKYFAAGLEHALFDLPRSGAPVRISEQDEDAIILLASTPPPEGFRRWTLRLLAKMAVKNGFVKRISHNQIRVILRKKNHSLVKKKTFR